MLTEPSPLVSSLLKTSSACARLVPPAPSAFSNSDFEIRPSPLASICENRFCNALDGSVDTCVVAPVDDWPCAASSALMVAGDSWEYPPGAVDGLEPPAGGAPAVVLKGSVAASAKPAAWLDAELDEVSERMASSADEAAPRANSMAILRQRRVTRPTQFVPNDQQAS